MNRISKFMNENKISHYGLIRPEIIQYGKKLLENRISSYGYSEFAEKDLNRRIDSNEIMSGTDSILVVLFPYEMRSHVKRSDSYGVASFAEDLDYHIKNSKILKDLAASLELESDDYRIHIDNGPMVDRYLAYCAGLGWYGKNCLLINSELGSSFTIGSLFMKKNFEDEDYCNKTKIDGCGECELCLKACPNGAINDGYIIDSNICISERLQSKKELPYDMREKIIRGAYGCDICQEVCPYNNLNIEMKASTMNIYEDLNLGKKRFKEKYGTKAFAWRGNSLHRRNLLILLGNKFKGTGDAKPYEAALKFADSNSNMLASFSWWAMLRIDKERATSWIKTRLLVENDKSRVKEMKKLISYYCDEN
ncbi:MAG TPA: QueG-associated DUF1730 domain-containing protein [Clostridia bacterium]|nr:QueG-associated DUF1730 domain-containing protein [Clostridia bacterium]